MLAFGVLGIGVESSGCLVAAPLPNHTEDYESCIPGTINPITPIKPKPEALRSALGF